MPAVAVVEIGCEGGEDVATVEVVVVLLVLGEVVLLDVVEELELLEHGFHTVTTQPAALPVEDPPELTVDVVEDVFEVVLVEAVRLALAGKTQSGPVLPFALQEALSPMISLYSAPWAKTAEKRNVKASRNGKPFEFPTIFIT